VQGIKIKQEDYRAVVDYCKREFPQEACGILGGVIEQDWGLIRKIYYMSNQKASAESYFMDPDEQFPVFRDLRENDLELISIFHSHPRTPARPSRKDIEMAHYPEAVYSIISLAQKEVVWKGFLIEDQEYREIEVLSEKNFD